MPAAKSALPGVEPIDRRSMNVWEDGNAREAILATGRRRLIVYTRFITEDRGCLSARDHSSTSSAHG